jgi:hypothetical protein
MTRWTTVAPSSVSPTFLQQLFIALEIDSVINSLFNVCHGLTRADHLQTIIGTAVVLISSYSLSLRVYLVSDDSRTCDGRGSTAFHDVLFLGPVY